MRSRLKNEANSSRYSYYHVTLHRICESGEIFAELSEHVRTKMIVLDSFYNQTKLYLQPAIGISVPIKIINSI